MEKIGYKLFSLIFLSVMFSIVGVFATDISECGNITSNGYYELNQDLINQDSMVCLIMNISDSILDCNNYSLISNYTSYGIYVVGSNNFTIKNCNLIDFLSGIMISDVNNSNFLNININNASEGNTFLDFYSNKFENFTISESKIYVQDGDYNNFTNIIMTDSYSPSAFNLGHSNYNILDNLQILSAGTDGMLVANAYYNIIRNSIIQDCTHMGISMGTTIGNNSLYNNFFNNSDNLNVFEDTLNYYNSTLYGNYWATPNSEGYSETCTDSNSDNICDLPFDLKNEVVGCTSNNCDYLVFKISPTIIQTTFFNLAVRFSFMLLPVIAILGIYGMLMLYFSKPENKRDSNKLQIYIVSYLLFLMVIGMFLQVLINLGDL